MMKNGHLDENCIICGRGQNNYNHKGNKVFRDLVGEDVDIYEASSKDRKTEVVDRKTNEIFDKGMHFVEKKDGVWRKLTKEEARKKVAHRFRDAVEAKRKAEGYDNHTGAFSSIFSSEQMPIAKVTSSHSIVGGLKSSNFMASPSLSPCASFSRDELAPRCRVEGRPISQLLHEVGDLILNVFGNEVDVQL